jgi:glycosyltransferase involved in cell wall biosynthesis
MNTNAPQRFSLVIPLFNEAKNIGALMESFASSGLTNRGLTEVILVNNGSQDETGAIIDGIARNYPWVKPLHLPNNLNYGGGVYEGFLHAIEDWVGYIPGDLQVSAEDVSRVWEEVQSQLKNGSDSRFIVKGRRVTRHDPLSTRFVSRVYTVLGNSILGLRVWDVNGLPKILHRSLLNYLPQERMKTFVFDAQLLHTARCQGWRVVEVPVTFHARRAGVSSWSRKRFQTYRITLSQVWRLRSLTPRGNQKLISQGDGARP